MIAWSDPQSNTRLIKRLHELERFNIEDQEAILIILDAMIMKNKMRGAMEALD